MKDLDLASLRHFLAVCDTGSITRAAGREHIVPSTISKRLTQLEADLRATLFERGRRGITLTPAGETLMDHAHTMLASARQIASDMSGFGAGVRGKVRLLATMTAISEMLPDDISAFTCLPGNQHVEVDVEEADGRNIVRRIQEGSARLGVLWDGTHMEGLEKYPYRTDHLAVAVHPSHPLTYFSSCAFVDSLNWEHIGTQPLNPLHQMQVRMAALAGKRIHFRATVSSFEPALHMVSANLGVAVVPREIARGWKESGQIRVIPLSDPWARRQFVICRRAREKLPPAAQLLLEHLARRT